MMDKQISPRSFTPEYRLVALEELQIDGRFNRPISQAKVNDIWSRFDKKAFGSIVVSQRGPNEYVLLDGQHRVAVLQQAGFPPSKALIPALVWKNLALEDEALLFKQLNDTKLVSAYDKFRALVTAGDPDSIAIKKIVEDFDLIIASGTRDHVVSSVVALQRLYRKSEPKGQLLHWTLDIVTRTWGRFSEALKGIVLEGIGAYLHSHPDVDEQELIVRLARLGHVDSLIARAKIVRGSTPQITLADAINHAIERDVMPKRYRRKKSA